MLIDQAERQGHQRMIPMNRTVERDLQSIIASLTDGETNRTARGAATWSSRSTGTGSDAACTRSDSNVWHGHATTTVKRATTGLLPCRPARSSRWPDLPPSRSLPGRDCSLSTISSTDRKARTVPEATR